MYRITLREALGAEAPGGSENPIQHPSINLRKPAGSTDPSQKQCESHTGSNHSHIQRVGWREEESEAWAGVGGLEMSWKAKIAGMTGRATMISVIADEVSGRGRQGGGAGTGGEGLAARETSGKRETGRQPDQLACPVR